MSQIKDGGPAFPMLDQGAVHQQGCRAIEGVTDGEARDRLYIEAINRAGAGMTLRDYFAAKAMQSHLLTHTDSSTRNIVEWSYQVADEMIAARGQR